MNTKKAYWVSEKPNLISDALADQLPVVPIRENQGPVCPEIVSRPPMAWKPHLALPSSHTVLSFSLLPALHPLVAGLFCILSFCQEALSSEPDSVTPTPVWLLDPCSIYSGSPILWTFNLLLYLPPGTSCLSSGLCEYFLLHPTATRCLWQKILEDAVTCFWAWDTVTNPHLKKA